MYVRPEIITHMPIFPKLLTDLLRFDVFLQQKDNFGFEKS